VNLFILLTKLYILFEWLVIREGAMIFRILWSKLSSLFILSLHQIIYLKKLIKYINMQF